MIIIILIFVIIYLMESDRKFSKVRNFRRYYTEMFPLPILGIYNSIIRLSYPEHKHVFNPNLFNSDKILKKNFKIIQKECLNVYNYKNNLMNFADINKIIFYTDNNNDKWKAFPIKFYGEINETAKKLCPNLCNILNKCNDIHVAIISILEPGKHITPHKGPCSVILRYQLAIHIPKDKNNCWIKINNQKYFWKEGESIIFDDTYIHEVLNDTNEPRIVLLMDIERPVNSFLKKITKKFVKYSKLTKFIKNTNDNIEKNNCKLIK